jgi:hypothetical protein
MQKKIAIILATIFIVGTSSAFAAAGVTTKGDGSNDITDFQNSVGKNVVWIDKLGNLLLGQGQNFTTSSSGITIPNSARTYAGTIVVPSGISSNKTYTLPSTSGHLQDTTHLGNASFSVNGNPSNGQLLKFQSSNSTWIPFTDPHSVTTQLVKNTATFTTSSTSYVDVTNMAVTLPSRTGGFATVTFVIVSNVGSAAGNSAQVRVVDGATNQDAQVLQAGTGVYTTTITYNVALNGQVVKLQVAAAAGTDTISIYGTTSDRSYVTTLEVS